MKYEDYFILHIVNRLNGERSTSAVFHLLKGKRTSQTIQDGFLFQVHPYFHTLQHIERQELYRIITELEKDNILEQHLGMNSYILTSLGKEILKEHNTKFVIPSGLNGWFYGRLGKTFWKKLNLFVQTLSHLNAGESRFYPITRNEETLKWVKKFLLSSKMSRKEILVHIRHELEMAWSNLPEIEASLLTQRLSGFQCDGFSVAQLSDETGKSHTEIALLLQSGIHRTIQMLDKREHFPILSSMLDKGQVIGLTDSARKSFIMLQSGQTLETIAESRRLKPATIQDHIVEIAFCDPWFSIEPYVSKTVYQTIVKALEMTDTLKLSAIKDHCPSDVQYFHIRLVLARERI